MLHKELKIKIKLKIFRQEIVVWLERRKAGSWRKWETSIEIGNKVRRWSFIKKKKLYPQLKMEINLIPLERLVGSWQQCLNSWGIFYKNTFKENYGYFNKKTNPTLEWYLPKENKNRTTILFSWTYSLWKPKVLMLCSKHILELF